MNHQQAYTGKEMELFTRRNSHQEGNRFGGNRFGGTMQPLVATWCKDRTSEQLDSCILHDMFCARLVAGVRRVGPGTTAAKESGTHKPVAETNEFSFAPSWVMGIGLRHQATTTSLNLGL